MLSILVGIAIIIVAVVEWFAHISVIHAIAILTGIVGLIIALYGAVPVQYTRFGPRA